MFRVASFDGGGVRGVIPSYWVYLLESQLHDHLWNYLDMVGGSSTGAILAAGVATGKSGASLLQFYRQYSEEIFPPFSSRIWKKLVDIPTRGFDQPKHDGRALKSCLIDLFEGIELGELPIHTVVLAYDATGRDAIFFNSWDEKYKRSNLVEVLLASTAAPTYLPGQRFNFFESLRFLIDGGVVMNNPSAILASEAIRISGGSDIVLGSFGTGQSAKRISAEKIFRGRLGWLPDLLSVLMDGNNDASNRIALTLLGDNFHRFKVVLDSSLTSMDNSSSENIEKLINISSEAAEGELKESLMSYVSKLRPPEF